MCIEQHHSILVDWLCLTSHRQRGHLETTSPFTVPCEGHEAPLLHRPHRESNPGSFVENEFSKTETSVNEPFK